MTFTFFVWCCFSLLLYSCSAELAVSKYCTIELYVSIPSLAFCSPLNSKTISMPAACLRLFYLRGDQKARLGIDAYSSIIQYYETARSRVQEYSSTLRLSSSYLCNQASRQHAGSSLSHCWRQPYHIREPLLQLTHFHACNRSDYEAHEGRWETTNRHFYVDLPAEKRMVKPEYFNTAADRTHHIHAALAHEAAEDSRAAGLPQEGPCGRAGARGKCFTGLQVQYPY